MTVASNILPDHRHEFLMQLKALGYSRLSLETAEFALMELIRYAQSSMACENFFVEETFDAFLKWKILDRRKKKYHPSYRTKVRGLVPDFFKWYFRHSKKREFDHDHLIQMTPAYVAEHPGGYPRSGMERQNKPQQFFEYLQKNSVTDLKLISPELVSNFLKDCELGFYKNRKLYAAHYSSSILCNWVRRYFLFLGLQGIIDFKMPMPPAEEPSLLSPILPSYLQMCLEARGIKPKSAKFIERTLKHFSQSLDRQGVSAVRAIAICHFDMFQFEGRNKGFPTKMTEISILRRFLKWLYLEGHIESDLSTLIISPRRYAQSQVPNFLSEPELKTLFDFAKPAKSKADRLARCTIEILLYTGLRVGEVALLEIGDINWKEKTATIRNRKNGTDLLVPLSDNVIKALSAHIANDRPQHQQSDRIFFTVLAPTKALTPKALSTCIRRYFSRKGISGGAHRLRHTFAQRLLDSGSSLDNLQAFLGHNSVQSTRIYTKTSMIRMRQFVVGNDR